MLKKSIKAEPEILGRQNIFPQALNNVNKKNKYKCKDSHTLTNYSN